jgi:hypothetical protein
MKQSLAFLLILAALSCSSGNDEVGTSAVAFMKSQMPDTTGATITAVSTAHAGDTAVARLKLEHPDHPTALVDVHMLERDGTWAPATGTPDDIRPVLE